MKFQSIVAVMVLLAAFPFHAIASTDGIYGLNKNLTSSWDGTNASLIAATSGDYDFAYGDEANVTHSFPQSWPSFTFYGQAYTQITADTNGNIWFGTPGTSNSFVLSTTGPVISAWNNDLSSYFNGGVFVQHKTDLPLGERVVIEWQAETYTDAGTTLPSNFEVVLFKNGDIRVDYKSFEAVNAKDSGSGISNNDGPNNPHFLSITSAYFPVYQLAGNSYGFTTSISTLQVTFAGTGNGTITSSPEGIACNTNCSATFPTGEQITLTPAGDQYSSFIGWSNGNCTGTGNCVMALNADSSETATFNIEASRISGTFYPTLQDAYNSATTADTIYAWDVTFTNGLVCDRLDAPDLTILGGYDPIYSAVTGMTKLSAPLIIQQGSVRVSNLTIVDSGSQAGALMVQPAIMSLAITTSATTATSGPALIRAKVGNGKKHRHDDDKEHDRDDGHDHHGEHRDDHGED